MALRWARLLTLAMMAFARGRVLAGRSGYKPTTTVCSLEIDGQTNRDAAWYYPAPKDAAGNIKGYVAFWRGVEVR